MLKCNNFVNVDCNKYGYVLKFVLGDFYILLRFGKIIFYIINMDIMSLWL